MARRSKKKKKLLGKYLELTGKPIFFLFTFIVATSLTVLHTYTKYTHSLFRKLKKKKIRISTRKKRVPQKYHFRWVKLPRLSLPVLRTWLILPFLLLVGLIASVSAIYVYLLRDLPSPLLLREKLPSLSTKIYDRNHTLLYQVYRDENRTLVTLDDLPPHLIAATIASEDKNFYSHQGIDIKGILRAVVSNTRCRLTEEKCNIQGGSTLTQQLVKNAFLTPQKSYVRKLREAYLAFQAERMFSKEEILEMYFNYVPYGGTSYGIEEAAHQYFGKSARDLTLAESTLLAGLPVAPTTLSPFGTRPYLAKNRQAQVLDAMVEMGYITDAVALAAKAESLAIRPQSIEIRAPHFVMYVKDLLVQEYGEDMVSRGGLEVVTSLDLGKQEVLEREITRELAKLKSLRVGNGAGIIAHPPTGEILAMVGSHDFFDSNSDGQVNVALMPRQPGSSIKPITYTLALMNGLTPNSRLEDTPVCFIIPGSPNYCPDNYDGRFHGYVTLRTALASSYNIPAIKLLNSLGVSRMVALAKQMGITTWTDPSRFGLSLTLGGGEVTMYDMVQVYSVFANNGEKIPLRSILSVHNSLGQDITKSGTEDDLLTAQATEGPSSPRQVIPAGIAYQISSILSDPAARAPAFGTRSVLTVPGYQVAVKTGTTNNLRDNWTIGYTPNLLVATWVGNNDNSPMSSVASGITGASPIWSRTMSQLLADSPPIDFPQPPTMVAIAVCPTTGAPYCSNLCDKPPRTEYFIKGSEPKKDCTVQGDIAGTGISTYRPLSPTPSPSPVFRQKNRHPRPTPAR